MSHTPHKQTVEFWCNFEVTARRHVAAEDNLALSPTLNYLWYPAYYVNGNDI